MKEIEQIFSVKKGERKDFAIKDLHIHRLSELAMPGTIMRGTKPGPTLALVAGVHGDELNGVAIVRKIIDTVSPSEIRGTLLCLPTINVWGLLGTQRHMVDGRDLNRRFPGLHEGSFTSRMAHKIFSIIKHCDYCIDFHTGTDGRKNVPQTRADLATPGLRDMCKAFGMSIIYDHPGEEGTLRREANKIGVKSILYEGGESGRTEKKAIEAGCNGAKNVMSWLGMAMWPQKIPPISMVIDDAKWIRSPTGGILEFLKGPGELVEKGETFVEIDDIFGTETRGIKLDYDAVIIGTTNRPLVVQGYPIAHVIDISNLDGNIKALVKSLKKVG